MYYINVSQYSFIHPLVVNLTSKYKQDIINASSEQKVEVLKDFLANGFTSEGHRVSRLKRKFAGVLIIKKEIQLEVSLLENDIGFTYLEDFI
jgi:hypothetical protein